MTIWKYPLSSQRIKMPMGARPLSVGLDPSGIPCIWCQVEEVEPGRWYDVLIVVTGGEMPGGDFVFVGSFLSGAFVGHVFFNPDWKIVP